MELTEAQYERIKSVLPVQQPALPHPETILNFYLDKVVI
jgi:hypothetical protein